MSPSLMELRNICEKKFRGRYINEEEREVWTVSNNWKKIGNNHGGSVDKCSGACDVFQQQYQLL
jgi:hypothetical protein